MSLVACGEKETTRGARGAPTRAGPTNSAADAATPLTPVCQHGGAYLGDDAGSLCDCPAGTRGEHCEIYTLALSAGISYTCALQSDEALTCWGDGPTPPPGAFKSVFVGVQTTCAIRTDGTLSCWDHAGAALTPPGGQFLSVATAFGSSCAVTLAGNIVCWGVDGTLRPSPLPDSDFVSVVTGGSFTCGLKSDATVTCNGIATLSGQFTQLSASETDLCGLKIDGTMVCEGATYFGPEKTNSIFKWISVGLSVAGGASHLCAVNPDGSLGCWGASVFGPQPSGVFTAVAAGLSHDCALAEAGSIVCWGGNDSGESTPPKQPGRIADQSNDAGGH
ncbi:MAG TPA: hypothetical protein VL137_12120 [Polyangiaceae bacterium]|nr:hypothetical protein [Polyangiaceae bacterium]